MYLTDIDEGYRAGFLLGSGISLSLPDGKEGSLIKDEEECTLVKYDTGWRAEKIASIPW